MILSIWKNVSGLNANGYVGRTLLCRNEVFNYELICKHFSLKWLEIYRGSKNVSPLITNVSSISMIKNLKKKKNHYSSFFSPLFMLYSFRYFQQKIGLYLHIFNQNLNDSNKLSTLFASITGKISSPVVQNNIMFENYNSWTRHLYDLLRYILDHFWNFETLSLGNP